MAEICSCEDGILNFGQPNCVNSFLRDSRLIFVNYLDDSGAVNSIKSTDTLNQTFFDGKFNNADLSQRWYITPTINNVVGERADNVTQDIDGISYAVRQGNRMYDGTFYGGIASPTFQKALDSMACQSMGFFIVDVAGNVIGMEDASTGDLNPIRIQISTFQTKYKFPSSSEVQNINIKFMWEENERDSNLSYIGSGNISVNMLTQKSMSTVEFGTATGISTTAFTTTMSFLYGEVFSKQAYTGAVLADFTLYNETTTSSVAITSVTESSDGVYDFVIPAQSSADVLTLSYSKATGAGFESKTSLTVTIP